MSDTLVTDDPLIGRILDGKYSLECRIGVGGMATVYSARRQHIGDHVAVKILNTGMPLSKIDLQRFELEARSAAKIKHPNVVSIFDYGSADGLPYLVMELLQGSSLEKELEEKTILDINRALEIIQPMCEGVNAAHAEGLIHRDLKPSNILFHHLKNGSEIVKVVDFGVAKLTNVNDTAYQGRLTKTGYLIGTPHYMSPEQIREQEISVRSDVYSLGVIIYEMLTGCLPFNAENIIDLLLAHLENSPKPLRELTANIPAGVDEAVMRALCKDPAKRQASTRELCQQILSTVRGESILTSEQSPLRRSSGIEPSPQLAAASLLSKKRTNLMIYDTLTGLYNNVFMKSRLEEGLAESKANNERTAILLFGIDDFRNINQRFGFITGDWVLKEFGHWLERIIGERGIIGRLRGDEFLVILFKTEGKSALQIGQEVLDQIGSSLTLTLENNNISIRLTAGAGVAQFPGDGNNAAELIEQAHLGLREAKSQGHNKIEWLKQVQSLLSLGPVYSFDHFINRKAELEKLEREFDRMLSSQGRAICIVGDTGIGKKRLAEEFRRRLTSKNVLFLQGRFFESNQAIPYKTIYDSLHTHLSTLVEENPDTIRERFGALADRIIKDFQEGESFRFFKNTVQTGNEQDKYITFEYLSKIFLALSRKHPVVFLLDGLQWADNLSLEFLTYLNHNTTNSRLMFIGCARTEGLSEKHPLRTWLRNMSRSGCDILQLQPLCEHDLSQMVEAIFTRAIFPSRTIKLLYRETKGNPYFLIEIIRLLIDEGIINFRDGVWRCEEIENITLPRSLVDVVEALLGKLEKEVLEVFAKAALIGDTFSFELLKRITKLDEEELLEHIDTGLKAQIIKEIDSNNEDEIYQFYHVIIQRVLYGRLNRRLRRSLHTQIGDTIEKLYGNNSNTAIGERAYHFHSAGDYQKSLKYSIEAGLRAWRNYSFDEALKFFSWGEEAAEKLGLIISNELESGVPDEQDLRLVAELTFNYGALLTITGKVEEATKQLEMAVKLASQLADEKLAAKTYNALAQLSEARSQYQQMIDLSNRALTIAEDLADNNLQATSHTLIGTAYHRLGQTNEALASFHKALNFAGQTSKSGEMVNNAITNSELAITFIEQGRYRDAYNYALESLKSAQSCGDRLSELIAQSTLGQIYFNQGELKKAQEHFEMALLMAAQLNHRREQAIEFYNIGEVNRAQGYFRQAIDYIQRSLEISKEISEHQYGAFAKLSLGLIYQAGDSIEQALEWLNQALQQQRDLDNKSAEAAVLLALAEIQHENKNYAEANYVIKQALDLISRLDNAYLYWRAHYINAKLLITGENMVEAGNELRKSVAIIETISDQISPGIDRQTFLVDKREVYDLLIKVAENS